MNKLSSIQYGAIIGALIGTIGTVMYLFFISKGLNVSFERIPKLNCIIEIFLIGSMGAGAGALITYCSKWLFLKK